ncbi:MAG: NAD(P)H-hydrate epimerase, partial [Treponema sp.]
MKAVYIDSAAAEKEAKARFSIPENVMMENAAAALEHALDKTNADGKDKFVLILCGGGNNGGDGLALARRIHGRIDCAVCLFSETKTQEAKLQKLTAQKIGV